MRKIGAPWLRLVAVAQIGPELWEKGARRYWILLKSYFLPPEAAEAYRYKTGIKAGMTGINNSTTGAEAHLPFGGVKGSGNGTRESGIWVIEAYSYWHAVNDELSGKLQLAQMDVDEIHIEEAEVNYEALA